MTKHSIEQKEAIINRFSQSNLSIREFQNKTASPSHLCIIGIRNLITAMRGSMSKNKHSTEQRFSIVLETATLSETELARKEKALAEYRRVTGA